MFSQFIHNIQHNILDILLSLLSAIPIYFVFPEYQCSVHLQYKTYILHTDPCADYAGAVVQLDYFISCRAYWQCGASGYATGMCCPEGDIFSADVGACVQDIDGDCFQQPCPPTLDIDYSNQSKYMSAFCTLLYTQCL
jgi:hypothetical protein